MPADEERHVVFGAIDDIHVHVIATRIGLGDRIDIHLDEELLDEVGGRVGLLLEIHRRGCL